MPSGRARPLPGVTLAVVICRGPADPRYRPGPDPGGALQPGGECPAAYAQRRQRHPRRLVDLGIGGPHGQRHAVRASTRSCCRMSSTGSSRARSRAAPGSAWRSPAAWSRPTAGRSRSRRRPVAAPRSGSNCRGPTRAEVLGRYAGRREHDPGCGVADARGADGHRGRRDRRAARRRGPRPDARVGRLPFGSPRARR